MRPVHPEFSLARKVSDGRKDWGLRGGTANRPPIAWRYLGRVDLALPNSASDPVNPR